MFSFISTLISNLSQVELFQILGLSEEVPMSNSIIQSMTPQSDVLVYPLLSYGEHKNKKKNPYIAGRAGNT